MHRQLIGSATGQTAHMNILIKSCYYFELENSWRSVLWITVHGLPELQTVGKNSRPVVNPFYTTAHVSLRDLTCANFHEVLGVRMFEWR